MFGPCRNSFSIFRMIVAIVWVSRQLTYESVDCSRGSRGSRLLESPNGVFLLIFIGCSTAFAATFETSWWKLPPVPGPCRFQGSLAAQRQNVQKLWSVQETAGRAAVPKTAAKTMETVTKASEEDIYLQEHANIWIWPHPSTSIPLPSIPTPSIWSGGFMMIAPTWYKHLDAGIREHLQTARCIESKPNRSQIQLVSFPTRNNSRGRCSLSRVEVVSN